MAYRRIFTINNENELQFLRKISKPVTAFDDRLAVLLDDMKDTLRRVQGAGLSAVQIGSLKRVFIIEEDGEMLEFVNPEILSTSGKNKFLEEGCLSVPSAYGKVDRPNKVRIKAQDRFGNWFTKTFTGFSAKAICHESDHLDGKLYIDYVPLDELTSTKKW